MKLRQNRNLQKKQQQRKIGIVVSSRCILQFALGIWILLLTGGGIIILRHNHNHNYNHDNYYDTTINNQHDHPMQQKQQQKQKQQPLQSALISNSNSNSNKLPQAMIQNPGLRYRKGQQTFFQGNINSNKQANNNNNNNNNNNIYEFHYNNVGGSQQQYFLQQMQQQYQQHLQQPKSQPQLQNQHQQQLHVENPRIAHYNYQNSFINNNNNNNYKNQPIPGLPSWIQDSRRIQQQLLLNRNNNNNNNKNKCNEHFQHELYHPNHGCQTNLDIWTTSCNFQNLQMNIDKIKLPLSSSSSSSSLLLLSSSSALSFSPNVTNSGGGEPLTNDIMGRPEEFEYPTFDFGAFSILATTSIANRTNTAAAATAITSTNKTVLTSSSSSSSSSQKLSPSSLSIPIMDIPDAILNKLRYMGIVLNSMNFSMTIQDWKCDETWSGTTLFITRYEYVNLYHTLTDWWNAYFSLFPIQDDHNDDNNNNNNNYTIYTGKRDMTNLKVVFLDAHAQGNLDSVWERLFGPYIHVKRLSKNSNKDNNNNHSDNDDNNDNKHNNNIVANNNRICFEKAIFIPPGYRSELFPHYGDGNGNSNANEREKCPNAHLANAFSNHVLKSYGLLDEKNDNNKNNNNDNRISVQKGKIVIIDRQPYLAHPRSNVHDGRRMLTNLNELRDILLSGNDNNTKDDNYEDNKSGGEHSNTTTTTTTTTTSSSITNNSTTRLSVDVIRLETMSFEEQLRTIRQAHVVIGNHGAGLSHVMFMDPIHSYLLELNAQRNFFEYLSEWKGVRYETFDTEMGAIMSSSSFLTRNDMETIKQMVLRMIFFPKTESS